MTYELAKKLEDAGWPQNKSDTTRNWIDSPNDNTSVVAPTLSELIEACGDKLAYITKTPYHFCLSNNPQLWRATATEGFIIHEFEGDKVACDQDCCGWTEGDTPEEAVAKLWLELNS